VTSPKFLLPLSASARRARAVILFALLTPAALLAAEEKKQNGPGEKLAELYSKLNVMFKQEKPDYGAAIDLVDKLVPTLAPDSYDLAQALQMKGKLLLQKDELSKAVEPLEAALKISDAHQYFELVENLILYDLLARLYAGSAGEVKTAAAQEPLLAKSINYFRRWFKESPKPNPDLSMVYAQILVQYAMLSPDKVDQAALKEAKGEVDKLLYSSIKPKETVYALQQFIAMQQGDMEKSAQQLELLASLFPNKANYWNSLFGTYNALAQANDKDHEKMRRYYIRAINTMERAQAYGFMKTPKDQFNLVTIYTIIGQFGRSTELLHAGLRSGGIESDVKNWAQLAYAYQMAHRELDAINALKEAEKLFPSSGLIDFNIANIYYGLEDTKNANTYFRAAVQKKGDLDAGKIYPTLRVIAYTSMELGDLDEALKAVQQAEAMKEGASDPNLKRIKDSILTQIEDREQKAKAAAEAAKAPKATP
jgi:hypothetical protein